MRTLPFIVIFEGRAGSSELMARLNKNHHVEALPEILHPLCGERGLNVDWSAVESMMSCISKGQPVNNYKESYSKDVGTEIPPIRGFKTRLNTENDRWWYESHGIDANFYSVPAARLLPIASRLGYRLIYLYRQDLVRQSISWIRAAELGRRNNEWNVLATSEPLGPIALDPEDVIQTIEWLSHSKKLHANAYYSYAGPKMSICYEKLFSSDLASYLDLNDFLGTQAHVVNDHYRKATPEDLSKAVSNWSAIKTQLDKRFPDSIPLL